MAKLEVYNSFEEKNTYFDGEPGILCGQVDLLFSRLEELYKEGKYIFRGINNSKYKLYSSAQRLFLKREVYAIDGFSSADERFNEWIKQLLNSIKGWNQNSIERYFESIGIQKDDDISFLSLLQHLGFPTPLIDFTLDPFIALYFATEGVDFNCTDNNLDSSFSLYYLDITTFFHTVLNSDHKVIGESDSKCFNDFIQKHAITIIEHNSMNYKVITNMNIVNQKGCFVFNFHSVNPLEVAQDKLINQLNSVLASDKQIDKNKERIICLNIHKSLVPKIKFELNKRKLINMEYIYPKLEEYKDKLIDMSLSTLIK